MSNKNYVINELKKYGLTLGCYSDILEEASKRTINKALEYAGDYHDMKCTIKGKPYIIEVACVGNEFDMVVLTPSEYSRYL